MSRVFTTTLKTLPAVAAALLISGEARAQTAAPGEPYWTPDAAMIARLEAGLKVPGFPQAIITSDQLKRYDRFYEGVTEYGQRQIRGVLLLPLNREDNPQTGIHITDAEYLPTLRGYGCANIAVTYFVDRNFGIGQCSTTGAFAPAPQQPHWKPDEQTAKAMEVAIQNYVRRAYSWLADISLSDYHRYYHGVTIDGKSMIQGSIILERSLPREGEPRMHLSSEPSLVVTIDGGCRSTQIVYDVSVAKFARIRCVGMESPTRPDIPLP